MNSPKTKPQVKVKPTPKKASVSERVTYKMVRPGRTEGKSGEVHEHELKVTKNADGRPVHNYFCTVEQGEFDHLFYTEKDGDGRDVLKSKHIVVKA